MNYIVEDIGYDTAKNALADHGFGLEELKDGCDQVVVAVIWTDNNIQGSGEIGGFRVGTITRSTATFGGIYRLELTEHNIGCKDRLTKVFSQIIHHTGIR